MTKVTCGRCGYNWEYTGRRTHWANCPNCKTSVRLTKFVAEEKNKVKKLQKLFNEADAKLSALIDFIEQKAPHLMEEWRGTLVRDANKQSGKQFDLLTGEKWD